MAQPYPFLVVNPESNLSFAWAFKEPSGGSSFSAELGPAGVGVAAKMIIQWEDLSTACQELLGYSYREVQPETTITGAIAFSADVGPMSVTTVSPHGQTSGTLVDIDGGGGGSVTINQQSMTVRDATHFDVAGNGSGASGAGGTWTVAFPGRVKLKRKLPWQHPYWNQLFVKNISDVHGVRQTGTSFETFDPWDAPEGGVGPGSPNTGPWTTYDLAVLTIGFWRPPYYVRNDDDILDEDGNPQEWLRYVSKHWQSEVQMLSRRAGEFKWMSGQGDVSTGGAAVPGSVGQVVSHEKISRRWFQIPEAAIFQVIEQYGTPEGLPTNLMITQTPTENPVTGFIYLAGSPIKGCVNSPKGGGTFEFLGSDDLRFFGCGTGTLRLDGIDILPMPLQLPAKLMQIPAIANNEPLSQQQYDVVFNFDYFDPPRSPLIMGKKGFRGHNLLPWSRDGMWYMITSPGNVGGVNVRTTMHQYADFFDLFEII